MRHAIRLGIFGLICVAFPLRADDITILAPAFTELVTEEGRGHYQIILQEAAFRAGRSYRQRYFPQKRAFEEFVRGDDDCIFDFTRESVDRLGPGAIIASYPFSPFRLHIFTARDAKPIASVDALRGKLVGGVLGHEAMYRSVLPDDILIEYVADDPTNIRKLNGGRVDAILGFLPDLGHYAYGLSFDDRQPLFERFDRLTCKVGPERRGFLRAISDQFREMHADGTLAKILGPHTLWFKWEDDELMP